MIAGKSGALATLQRSGGNVSPLNTAPLPNSAAGLTITHDGKLIIAAAIDRVLFLDPARLISGDGNPVLGSFSDGRGSQSIWVNTTADDALLFVSEEAAAAITVIDLARARREGFHADAIIGKIPVGRAPIALTFSPDGRLLYTTSELASKDWGWPAACKPEGRPGNEPVNPEGAVVVIDVARARSDPAHSVIARVPAGCSPVRLALSPAGDRLYATARNSNSVVSFDAAKLATDPDHARLGMAPVGSAPVPIALIDGGKRIVVGNSNRFAGSNAVPESLTILDPARIRGNADATLGSLTAGAFPRDLRLSPDGSTLFVANFASKTLQVIDVARLAARPRD